MSEHEHHDAHDDAQAPEPQAPEPDAPEPDAPAPAAEPEGSGSGFSLADLIDKQVFEGGVNQEAPASPHADADEEATQADTPAAEEAEVVEVDAAAEAEPGAGSPEIEADEAEEPLEATPEDRGELLEVTAEAAGGESFSLAEILKGAKEKLEEAEAPKAKPKAKRKAKPKPKPEPEPEVEAEEDEEAEPQPLVRDVPDDGLTRRWYALHAHSGQEGNVKEMLTLGAEQQGLDAMITNVLVPMEEVAEVRGGQKKLSKRKFFPGYVLVQLPEHPEKYAELWHLIKETPGVSGFIGGRQTPVPLEDDEVNQIIEEIRGERERPRPKIKFGTGERVKIVDGPFANFMGNIDEINEERGTLKIMVEIFERLTSVEVEFWQVEQH